MLYGAIKSYANGILTVAAGPDLTDLQTVNKHVNAPWVFTFCQFSEADILKSGNVVPNSFHFYARWNECGSGKSVGVFLNRFLPGQV